MPPERGPKAVEYRSVIFDVDGTLYDQRRLRRAMAARLFADAIARRSLVSIRVVMSYRRARERLADAEEEDFEVSACSEVALRMGLSEEGVRNLVRRWIHERPLSLLGPCIYPGVRSLFRSLRDRGTQIGVLSDYPARAKLQALGLDADEVVAATDPEVGVQKPNPKGLRRLLERLKSAPEQTIVVGDRLDRDGAAAARAGADFALRCDHKVEALVPQFHSYEGSGLSVLLGLGEDTDPPRGFRRGMSWADP